MEEENQCFLLSEYSHRYGALEASRLKLMFVAEHLHIPVGIRVTTVLFPTNPLKPSGNYVSQQSTRLHFVFMGFV
jgi:hypothetical protein